MVISTQLLWVRYNYITKMKRYALCAIIYYNADRTTRAPLFLHLRPLCIKIFVYTRSRNTVLYVHIESVCDHNNNCTLLSINCRCDSV